MRFLVDFDLLLGPSESATLVLMHGRDEIVRSVLELPERERAEVVREILDSLDQGTDHGAEEAWAREVAQRIRDLTAGEAIDRARSKLEQRR